MKTCIKCGFPKVIEDFYVHPAMADGHLGKCKQCCKDDSNARRALKIEEIKVYDRLRASLPHRVEARKIYRKENQGPFSRANRKWRLKNPDKYKAESFVGRELRAGRIKKGLCEVCGQVKTEAHHDDYTKPLEVRWLCKPHHVVADKTRRTNEGS